MVCNISRRQETSTTAQWAFSSPSLATYLRLSLQVALHPRMSLYSSQTCRGEWLRLSFAKPYSVDEPGEGKTLWRGNKHTGIVSTPMILSIYRQIVSGNVFRSVCWSRYRLSLLNAALTTVPRARGRNANSDSAVFKLAATLFDFEKLSF